MRKGEKEERRVSNGVARQNASLLYERNGRRNPQRKKEREEERERERKPSLPLMMLYSRLPRSLVPTRRFALFARFSRTGRVCISSEDGRPSHSAPEDHRAGADGEEIGAIVKRSIITVLPSCLDSSSSRSYFARRFVI